MDVPEHVSYTLLKLTYMYVYMCVCTRMYVAIRDAAAESQRKAAAKSGKGAEVKTPAPIVSVVFSR